MEQESAIIQNLVDAGCAADFIKHFMTKHGKDRKNDELKLLDTHRQALLGALHQNQKRIDCLDYLIYQLQKSEKESLL